METITIEINDDGSVRVTEDEGDQATEPMMQEFDSVGEAAQALMEMNDAKLKKPGQRPSISILRCPFIADELNPTSTTL